MNSSPCRALSSPPARLHVCSPAAHRPKAGNARPLRQSGGAAQANPIQATSRETRAKRLIPITFAEFRKQTPASPRLAQ